jgi:ribonuclease T1
MRLKLPMLLLLAAVAVLLTQWTSGPVSPVDPGGSAAPGGLPPEAIETLQLIERGGPFPHRQDGSVFQNRERLLPNRARGYYREYTVRTPGAPDRGARRIVTGGDPPGVFYYTEDHYRSFREIEVPR